jgi:hypothetical protein
MSKSPLMIKGINPFASGNVFDDQNIKIDVGHKTQMKIVVFD